MYIIITYIEKMEIFVTTYKCISRYGNYISTAFNTNVEREMIFSLVYDRI